ncbi:MAG: DUF1905 domain-containing protein [Sphingomonadaceae bacterium]
MREIMMIIGDDDPAAPIVARGQVWVWHAAPPAKGSWHFMTIDADAVQQIRMAASGRGGGWGSIKVGATLGDTIWQTSLFPHKETRGYMLPLKADVRKREGIGEGDAIEVSLVV